MQWKVEVSIFLIVIFRPTCHGHVAGTRPRVKYRVFWPPKRNSEISARCSLLDGWFMKKNALKFGFLPLISRFIPCTGIAKEDWTLHPSLSMSIPFLITSNTSLNTSPARANRAIHDCARPTDALCLNEAVRIVVFQFRPGKEKHSSALFKQ